MVGIHGVTFCGKYKCISLPDVSVLLPVVSLKKTSQPSMRTYLFWLFHQCSVMNGISQEMSSHNR